MVGAGCAGLSALRLLLCAAQFRLPDMHVLVGDNRNVSLTDLTCSDLRLSRRRSLRGKRASRLGQWAGRQTRRSEAHRGGKEAGPEVFETLGSRSHAEPPHRRAMSSNFARHRNEPNTLWRRLVGCCLHMRSFCHVLSVKQNHQKRIPGR